MEMIRNNRIRLVEIQTPDSFRIRSECDSPHDTINWRAVCVSELELQWSLVSILNYFFHPSYFILHSLQNLRNCLFYVRDSFSSISGRTFEDPKGEIRSRKSKMNKLSICDKKKLYTES